MANTYKALSTVTVGAGGASSIAFTNIPQTYTDLVIQVSGRDNRTNLTDDFGIQINGSTSTFSYRAVVGSGSSVSANSNTFSVAGIWNGNTSTSSIFGNATIYIPNYTSSNPKAITSDSVMENNGAYSELWLTGTLWNTSTPITSITIVGNNVGSTILQHSTATLYGVFNADVSTAPATPTIGTATAGNANASITFTGVSNAASYTMTSTPGSITGTGATSPITVSGLSNGTAYTFKVKSNNPFGSSAESAASNSVTPSAASYYSIASTTVGAGGAAEVTFSGIPATYKHLQVRFYAPSAPSAATSFIMRVGNGSIDTGASYSFHSLFGYSNNGNGATQRPNETGIEVHYCPSGITSPYVGIIDLLDYADTNKYKTTRSMFGHDNNSGNSTNAGQMWFVSGNWRNNSAITDIRLYHGNGNLPQNTRIALYGMKV
jgi:hypothetical protein